MLKNAEAHIEAMIAEVVSNTKEMKKSTADIKKINGEIVVLKAFDAKEEKEEAEIREDIKELVVVDELQDAAAAVIIADLQAEILSLKAFDAKEEKEEEEIRADIKDIQQKIAALKAKIALQDDINAEDHDITDAAINDLEESDLLQDVLDLEAAALIAALQAEILALKAKIELYETENNEDEDIIKGDVKVLQVDVKELQVNDKKEEAEKAMVLAAEIAILEAQLLELTSALNPVKPATHPVLY